jgi:hypothetical protein
MASSHPGHFTSRKGSQYSSDRRIDIPLFRINSEATKNLKNFYLNIFYLCFKCYVNVVSPVFGWIGCRYTDNARIKAVLMVSLLA